MILSRFSCLLIAVSDLFPKSGFYTSCIANQQLLLKRSILLSFYFFFPLETPGKIP